MGHGMGYGFKYTSVSYKNVTGSELIQVFFLSIRTRNGPVAAPFISSTCDLLQIVAKTREFRLIYDPWYFILYEKYEKRRFESMRF